MFFNKESDEQAICSLCGDFLSTSSQSTSGLLKHLSGRHKLSKPLKDVHSCLHPLSLATTPRMRHFLWLISGHNVPHRTTLTRLLPNLKDQVKLLILEKLSKVDNAAVCLDFWTQNKTAHSFGTISLSIIGENRRKYQ